MVSYGLYVYNITQCAFIVVGDELDIYKKIIQFGFRASGDGLDIYNSITECGFIVLGDGRDMKTSLNMAFQPWEVI